MSAVRGQIFKIMGETRLSELECQYLGVIASTRFALEFGGQLLETCLEYH